MASEQGFVPASVNVEIEGDITVPGAPDEDEGPSTLDEPVSETLVSCISAYFCFIWGRKLKQSDFCMARKNSFSFIQLCKLDVGRFLFYLEARFEGRWKEIFSCFNPEAKQEFTKRL